MGFLLFPVDCSQSIPTKGTEMNSFSYRKYLKNNKNLDSITEKIRLKRNEQEKGESTIVIYCRNCNVKLKTKGGRNFHINQNHEVLSMEVLPPIPNPDHTHPIVCKSSSVYEQFTDINTQNFI